MCGKFKYDIGFLRQRQSLSLKSKILMTKDRIQEWYDKHDGNVFVSFSGGKDSTVLLDIVRQMYPSVEGVFFDTGLEYPEIRDFVKTIDNIVWLRPKKTFVQIINEYGYPVISKEISHLIHGCRNSNDDKHEKFFNKIPNTWKYIADAPFDVSDRCCYWLKKELSNRYYKTTKKVPILATLACESKLREKAYLKTGCNYFDKYKPHSTPMAFWLEKDVLEYIKQKKVKICDIYNHGYSRTGCMFCMFGIYADKIPNRFQKMKKTHPRHWNLCINKLKIGEVLDYIGIPYE